MSRMRAYAAAGKAVHDKSGWFAIRPSEIPRKIARMQKGARVLSSKCFRRSDGRSNPDEKPVDRSSNVVAPGPCRSGRMSKPPARQETHESDDNVERLAVMMNEWGQASRDGGHGCDPCHWRDHPFPAFGNVSPEFGNEWKECEIFWLGFTRTSCRIVLAAHFPPVIVRVAVLVDEVFPGTQVLREFHS